MKKRLRYLAIAIVPAVVLGLCLPSFAQEPPPSFIQCTDKPEYDQVKVAQVPIPWQFWAITTDPTTGVTTVTDKIRISPTWLIPPPGQPPGFTEPVLIQRQVALTSEPVELENLVWTDRGPVPGLSWEPYDGPTPVIEGQDILLEVEPSDEELAVLVAYEVMKETDTDREVIGHFINEAILSTPEVGEPREIVEIRINFDAHNDTDYCVTNFELDFLGLSFTCEDVVKALGFVVGEPDKPWGANEENPLLVHPIEVKLADGTVVKGTEVKWVQPDRPLQKCEWLHLGLAFRINLPDEVDGNRVTVQGYWTELKPKVWCVEAVNPRGKRIPPAGWSTMPGPKGGRNDDGFYQLFAYVPCDPEPKIYVTCKEMIEKDEKFGPYDSSDVVKITEAPGAAPSEKKMGSSKGQAGAVKAHITLPSAPILLLIDPDGTIIARCPKCCLVPPPPK